MSRTKPNPLDSVQPDHTRARDRGDAGLPPPPPAPGVARRRRRHRLDSPLRRRPHHLDSPLRRVFCSSPPPEQLHRVRLLLLPIAREGDTTCHLQGVQWQEVNPHLVVLQATSLMLKVQNADSTEDRDDFEPKQWWGTHGGSTKFLKTLALKLLGQPSSSSCCERNWSTYSFIHSSARNKLTPERAEDLVFSHNNLRLLSRKSDAYHVGPSRMWDVGGDGVESFTGVVMLEGANLTLDEPELEAEIMDALT